MDERRGEPEALLRNSGQGGGLKLSPRGHLVFEGVVHGCVEGGRLECGGSLNERQSCWARTSRPALFVVPIQIFDLSSQSKASMSSCGKPARH